MRLLRLALLQFGVLLAATTVSVTPAQAGGWAVTVLDPLPTRVESGPAYTVGYWVLQHGSHPFEGTLGKTALEFVDQHGKTLTFPGVALPQPAHFAAAVALPHNGTWRMSAIQGIFQDYEIGTLTVPGKLAVNRPPMPMTENYKWGAIHPPDVAKMAAAPAANPASAPATSPAAVASARRPAAGSGSTPWLLPLLIALGVAGAGARAGPSTDPGIANSRTSTPTISTSELMRLGPTDETVHRAHRSTAPIAGAHRGSGPSQRLHRTSAIDSRCRPGRFRNGAHCLHGNDTDAIREWECCQLVASAHPTGRVGDSRASAPTVAGPALGPPVRAARSRPPRIALIPSWARSGQTVPSDRLA